MANLMEDITEKKWPGMPWYPKVDDESKFQNYIFLDTLQDDIWHSQVYDKAKNRFNLAMSSLKVGLNPQLKELWDLAEREERKEKDLLEEFVKKGTLSYIDAGNKLRGFNKLYQNKKILGRNLKKIEAVADGSRQGRIDITSSFRTYLNRAIEDYFSKTELKKINEKDLLEVVKQALIKAVSSRDSNLKGETQHSYEELIPIIEKMAADDNFIKEVFDLYFGTSWDKIKIELKNENKRKKEVKAKDVKDMITKSYGAGGQLFEYLQSLILDTLGEKNIGTGKSKQKSDITLLYAEVQIPTFDDKQDDSVRAYFIQKYREMYNNLEGATGSIVEINAKNYNLTTEYFQESGFSAQSLTSIKNLEDMLDAYDYNPERADRLIYALTNIGPDTLQENQEQITHNLAMLIAYFLFDDIDMDIGLGVQAVHLLNLDGVYVPLSCFLYAAYETLSDFENISDDMVKVMYSPESVNYIPSTPDDPLTKKKWEETVAKKRNQDSLKVSFFKNFPQYIKKNLSNFDF